MSESQAELFFLNNAREPISNTDLIPFSFGDHRGVYSYEGSQWFGLNYWHASLDVGNSSGIYIHPLYPGKVVFTGWTGMGNTIVIEHEIYGINLYSVYGHLGESQVATGIYANEEDKVSGQSIIGVTGYSKPGCNATCYKHLHFEVRKATNVNLSNKSDVLYGMRYWAFEGENWRNYFLDLGIRWGYEEDHFISHD